MSTHVSFTKLNNFDLIWFIYFFILIMQPNIHVMDPNAN